MLAIVTPEQVRAAMAMSGRRVKPATRLPKHLQWTLPLMDEVADEARKEINNPEPRPNFTKLMDYVVKELSAGKGDK